jgi:hypothetical protein
MKLWCKHEWHYVHPINAKLSGYFVCYWCGKKRLDK